jgi:hypothetical protein
MSNSASSSTAAATAAGWAAVKAEEDRQYRLAEQKRAEEFRAGIKADVAKLPSNPPTGAQWNRFSGEGGAKRKRTTRTKKMKRRHARKSHRKSKRVMKR